MAAVKCQCGAMLEMQCGAAMSCPDCGAVLRLLAAAGSQPRPHDFAARLIVELGPARVGEVILLGGDGPISVGKLPEQMLCLAGVMVSRHHCSFIPADGDRWLIEDRNSKNGIFINGQRVESQARSDGDQATIGDYLLRYRTGSAAEAPEELVELEALNEPEPEPEPPDEAPPPDLLPPLSTEEKEDPLDRLTACPNCGKLYGTKVRICVPCGIDLRTFRPLVISRGIDEDDVHGRAIGIARWVSWLIPLTIMPIPIASEAYGRHKPWAIQAIVALNIIITVAVWLAVAGSDFKPWGPSKNLEMWTGDQPNPRLIRFAYSYGDPASSSYHDQVRAIRQRERDKAMAKYLAEHPEANRPAPEPTITLTPEERETLRELVRDSGGEAPDGKLPVESDPTKPNMPLLKLAMTEDQITLEAYSRMNPADQKLGEFHYYQLLTNTFLHEGILHITGNMIFLLVFGNRINALIGQWKSAVVYLILAVAASGAFWISSRGAPVMPALGASGAIMGLAGMYFILMPVSKVHLLFWVRVGFLLPLTIIGLLGRSPLLCLISIFLVPLLIFLPRVFMFFRTKIVPVRGYWVLLFYIAFDVYATIFGSKDGVAHWAHLGGFLCGMAVAILMLLTRQVNANGGDMISLIVGPRAWKWLGTPEQRMAAV
jgi:membrane associated rhomboid family serine protease